MLTLGIVAAAVVLNGCILGASDEEVPADAESGEQATDAEGEQSLVQTIDLSGDPDDASADDAEGAEGADDADAGAADQYADTDVEFPDDAASTLLIAYLGAPGANAQGADATVAETEATFAGADGTTLVIAIANISDSLVSRRTFVGPISDFRWRPGWNQIGIVMPDQADDATDTATPLFSLYDLDANTVVQPSFAGVRFTLGFAGDGKFGWSPDGTTLAVAAIDGGAPEVAGTAETDDANGATAATRHLPAFADPEGPFFLPVEITLPDSEDDAVSTALIGEGIWSPDGSLIAFLVHAETATTQRFIIILFDASTFEFAGIAAQINAPSEFSWPAAWLPDSRQLIVGVREGPDEPVSLVELVATDTLEPLPLFVSADGVARFALSPNARTIAWINVLSEPAVFADAFRDQGGSTGGIGAIMLSSPATQETRRLHPDAERFFFDPAWSPDGKFLAVSELVIDAEWLAEHRDDDPIASLDDAALQAVVLERNVVIIDVVSGDEIVLGSGCCARWQPR